VGRREVVLKGDATEEVANVPRITRVWFLCRKAKAAKRTSENAALIAVGI
jgi:hypothetical protein